MRWCPNCKNWVDTHFTGGQIVIMALLLCSAQPEFAILYGCLHGRKCSLCGCNTIAEKTIVKDQVKAYKQMIKYLEKAARDSKKKIKK